MDPTSNTTYAFPVPPTRLRSRSGPDHLMAPTSKSRISHNTIHSVVLNSSNISRQITIISPDIKYKRELNKTKATLKQLQKDYTDLMELSEAEKLFYDTRECILNEKNIILQNLVSEYKEKYQQIEAKNKYIHNERDSFDIEIPVLEIELSGSNSKVTALQQSLHIAHENINRKDNKIKQLTQQQTNLQRINKILAENIQQLQFECLINTELDQSFSALESQIFELTEQNRMLKKEKNDLQDLLEGNDTNAYKIHPGRFKSIGLSSPSATGLDVLNHAFDNAIEPLVFVRLPSHSYQRTHATNGSVLSMCAINMRSSKMDDDMRTIEEEHDITDAEQLSVSDKQFSVSQDSRSVGIMSDGEDDVVELLMQNDEFINCDAVKNLKKDTTKYDDTIAQYLHLTACAVKIKYCDSKIKTDDLIRRVKHYSFYQYYDQMIRILEMEKQTNNNIQNPFKCIGGLTTCEKLVQHNKYTRNNNSIMNLKNIKSVTKNIKQWERRNSNCFNENKSNCKRKKRKSKKYKNKNKYTGIKSENEYIYNDNNIYNTMIYKKEDIEKANELYSLNDQ